MPTKEDKAKLDAGAAEIRKAQTDKATKPAAAKKSAPAASNSSNGMQFHPLCKQFSILPAKQLRELKEDIAAHGIKVPILVNKARDMIIDGRNRYMIAMDLGLDPKDPKQVPFEVYKGKDEDIGMEIIARNVLRRHLGDDARTAAIVALRAPQLEKEAAERKAKKGTFGSKEAGDVKGSVAAHIAKEAKVSQHKAEQALKARKAGVLGDVMADRTTLKKASKAAGKGKKRKTKEVPLEDRVWLDYAKLLKKYGLELEREVKGYLRAFLDNKRTK